jgi:hypothetical protein
MTAFCYELCTKDYFSVAALGIRWYSHAGLESMSPGTANRETPASTLKQGRRSGLPGVFLTRGRFCPRL